MQRCGGKTKAGAPCRAPAGADGLCFFHAHPHLTQTLGQIGGRKNRSQWPDSAAVETLSGAGLREILSEAIREVRSRKMTPRNAAALAQLSNSLQRVLPTADLENRLARIEQELAEKDCDQSVDPDPSSSGRSSETAEQDASSPVDETPTLNTAHSDSCDGPAKESS